MPAAMLKQRDSHFSEPAGGKLSAMPTRHARPVEAVALAPASAAP